MNISFEVSGGFVNLRQLNKPVVIDTAQLNPLDAKELESFVEKSNFFKQPAIQPNEPAKGAADYRTYTITINDDLNHNTIKLTDPVKDGNLRALVSKIQTIARNSTV